MIRSDGWEARLVAYVERAAARSFAWGTHDCVLFAAGAVEAIRGQSVLSELSYGSEAEARQVLTGLGHRSLSEAVDAVLGEPRENVLFAQRGDIALAPRRLGGGLGVVLGARVAHVGPRGLEFLPLRIMTTVWAV